MLLPALVLGVAAAAPRAGEPPAREARLLMGTLAEVRAEGLAEPGPALDAAFAALELVDRRMSLWKPSELVALNRAGAARLSAETYAVIAHALDVAAASGGAFDPTVEPLVEAGGGLGGPPRALDGEARRRLLERVGASRVHLDPVSRTVRLEVGARLDLGGIAKGYAADLALAALRAAGARSGLVDLGASSLGVFGEPLVVELRDPRDERAPPWASFRVEDACVASSGHEQRPGHILDPRDGRPAHRVLSATVVAASGIEADALSTALFVLGEDDGLALVRRRGAAGLVLREEAGRRIVVTTPGFAARYGLMVAPGIRVRP